MAKILVTGAGGFIGGALVKFLGRNPRDEIRAVDKKPIGDWYQVNYAAQNICCDLSESAACQRACEGVDEVYQLAADMGGMGFIERFRIACMRSVLINVHMLEAAYRAGVERFFYSSSACAYNTNLQQCYDVTALKESDAYPAMAERGYGWEKLYSEMLCQEYWAERNMKTFIARFHNVYGPDGTWFGGREKAPAAICRKVIEAKWDKTGKIDIWGNGRQTRSYMYIDDCVTGINRIMHHDALVGTPINLGSSEMISVNELVDIAEELIGVKLERRYELNAPQGVMGRNSDNTMIKQYLAWEPGVSIRGKKGGLAATCNWIADQFMRRMQGKQVVTDTI